MRLLSDHMPVSVNWKVGTDQSKLWEWQLNNYFLETPGLEVKVEREVRDFFSHGIKPLLLKCDLGYI